MPTAARLELFGVPTLEHAGQRRVLAAERRSQLLALLALRGGWVARSEAAAMLWPGLEGRLASTNLRKTLFRLAALPWGGCVLDEAGALRFDGQTDVAAFESALRDGRPDAALALRRGELLSGYDDDGNEAWTEWLGYERERLRAAWRGAALAWLEGPVPAAAALALSTRLLDDEPLDEEALRVHLQALQRAGQAAAARAAWQRFVARQRDELGLEPGAALLALGAALRPGAVPAGARESAPVAAPVRSGGAIDGGFIGRSGELRQIASRLEQDDCRLLSLLGPGGVGKTRLARRAMQELQAGFADGAVFVPLEDLPAEAPLGEALARALELRTDGSRDTMAAVSAALAPRTMLLVLDNAEDHVAQAAALLPLLEACPRLKLLVTSRTRLALAAEWTVVLQGLPCPEPEDGEQAASFDAVRLFVRTAVRVRPDFQAAAELDEVAAICRLVDGLPLALELAAAWVRLLSCREIAAELREGTALLQADDPSRAPRHAGIEQVFERSWQRLGARERDALARLAVFRGGFTAASARAVAGASMPVLGALLDRSLLHRDGERLRLHPLVQQLLRDRLPADERERTAEAHAHHHLMAMARLRRPAEVGARDALREMDAEAENHRAAWQHAAASGPWAAADDGVTRQHARRLADAALALMSHADHRGQRRQGLGFVRQALESPAARAWPALRALLRAICAHLEHRLDHDAEAERLALQALAEAGDTEPADAQLLALKVLGMATMRLGRLDDARRHHEAALRLVEGARDPDLAAVLLGNLALVERRCGRHDEAVRLLERAVLEHRRLGDAAREARGLNNLGALLSDRRAFGAAGGHFQAALALCERHGLRGTLGMVLGNLCYAALEAGTPEACERHGRRALEVLAEVDDRSTACSVRHSLALAALRRGDVDAAAELLSASMQDALAVGHPALKLLGLVVLVHLYGATGAAAAARAVARVTARHPAAAAHVRGHLDAACERLPPPLPGEAAAADDDLPPLDELVQRVAAGDDLRFAALQRRLVP